MVRPFHLAFPVRSLEEARTFYVDVLGCDLGRSGTDWLDIDFFGSQIVAHVLSGRSSHLEPVGTNTIDGFEVPLPHFGAVLTLREWDGMVERLLGAGTEWVVEPHTRYPGAANEQASMIFCDPAGNVIELKAFADLSLLFESE